MRLFVKVLSGEKTLSVRVAERGSVHSVKRRIAERLGVSTNDPDVRLYRRRQDTGELRQLDDTGTLFHNGINPGTSTLYLGMRICVHLVLVGGCDSGSSMDIHTSHSIEEVKKLIEKRLKIPPEQQRLILGGELLNDRGHVRDYNVRQNDRLYVVRRCTCHFSLTVKDSESGCDIATPNVKPSFTVETVKGMIAEMSGIPSHHQRLSFNNTVLLNQNTLKYYSIVRECTIALGVCTSQLFIRSLTGKTVTLNIGASESVESVKSLIEASEGIPPSQQKLTIGGREQLREGKLSDYRVQSGETLDLSLHLYGGGSMELCIRTTTGITIQVQADSGNTVLELKEKICAQRGYPVEEQKLIFVGKLLEDQTKLADYNIQGATTLHLVVGQPAGKKKLRITVIFHTEDEVCVRASLDDNVDSLMSAIEEAQSIPKCCQQLFYRGAKLEPQKLLKDYNFTLSPRAKHIVYLEVKGQIRVFVKILSSSSQNSAVKRFDKKISVSVEKEMKVSTLKQMIEHREKIPIYFQTLVYNGAVMEDDHLLEQHSVADKCVLHLWPERLQIGSRLKVTVQTTSSSLDLPALDLNTKIREVKRKSLCLVDVPSGSSVEQYALYYGSVLMENERSLREYMLMCGSTLHLMPPEHFPVFIQATTRGKYLVKARKTDTFKTLKEELFKVSDIPTEHDLYLSSRLVEDVGKTLEEYRISAACTLHSVPRGEMPITVRSRLATVHLSVDPAQSVSDITKKISQCPEIGGGGGGGGGVGGVGGGDVNKQRLIFRHTQISGEDEKRVKELQICSGNTLNLVSQPEELDVYVTTPRASTLMVVCHYDASIHDLKEAIEQSEDIPVESQILPFSDDEKTLRDYKVKPGTHLDLGHLSVTPLKTAVDQQELCERVIMQEHNQHLKQELESTKRCGHALQQELESTRRDGYVYEMQLDSASNYMQSKIATFEEQIAQSEETIAALRQENREMKQMLTKDKENMLSLETKLANVSSKVVLSPSGSKIEDFLSREDSTSTASTSQVMFSCSSIPEEIEEEEEEEDFGECPPACSTPVLPLTLSSAYGFYREFIYSGEESTFPCEEYGIRIRFPEHQVEREITMTVISLNTSGDDCTIECEDDAEFVSGIYRVRVSEPIPCPVTVQIQHCAIINTSEDTSTLTFLRSNTNEDYFAAIEGGKFDLESGYGQIELCQFSEFGIGRIFKRHGGTKYCASVFKKQREANTIDVHIVVTKNLAHHIRYLKHDDRSDYKDWELLVQPEVEFDGLISYKLDQAAEGSQSTHWTVKCIQEPAKIAKRSVKRYHNGRSPPAIRLSVTWESEERARKEDQKLTLTGAKDPDTEEPVSFVVECAPMAAFQYSSSISCDADVSSIHSSQSQSGSMRTNVSRIHIPEQEIFSERVNLKELRVIRYHDGHNEREIRTKEQMEPQWNKVAEQLEFGPAKIEAFTLRQFPADDMIYEWLRIDQDCSWRKLIEAMNDAGLRAAASDLLAALSSDSYQRRLSL